MSKTAEFEAPSWEQFYWLCLELADRVKNSGYVPELMVGIIRGGLVPLRILSDEFDNVDLATMRIVFYEDVKKTMTEPKIIQKPAVPLKDRRILIVDDVADTGSSLIVANDFLMENGAKEVKVATVYYKPWSKFRPDYFVKTTEKWIIFPHEKREAILTLSRRMLAEGIDRKEIRQRLIDFGLEPAVIDRCLTT
jgi:hypothetical protein